MSQSLCNSGPSNAIIRMCPGLAFASREAAEFFGHSLEKHFEGNSPQSWKSRVQTEPKSWLGVRAQPGISAPRKFRNSAGFDGSGALPDTWLSRWRCWNMDNPYKLTAGGAEMRAEWGMDEHALVYLRVRKIKLKISELN